MIKNSLLSRVAFTVKVRLLQICCVLLFASTAYADAVQTPAILNETITLSVSNMQIESVLKLVEKQTKVNFLYSPTAIDMKQELSFKGKNITLKRFLDKAIVPLNIGFKVRENKILLYTLKPSEESNLSLTSITSQADRTITGTVLGNENKPLEGASIKVTGSNIGTKTDAKGFFSLNVPEGDASLEVSYVGYVTQTVIVTGNTITITLLNAATTYTEVIVTALGISKASRKVGYAVTKVDGDLLSKAKEPNIAFSLEGRVPGLNINATNGGPGGSASILIRGISNMSSTTTGPLIIVDGVPMDNTSKVNDLGVYGGSDYGDGISSLNPDDIENIVVLKGSTASALYGVRAANGVIQVTTKSGKGHRGVGIEFNSNLAFNSVINNKKDFQKVYGQGLNGKRPQTIGEVTADDLNSWGEKLDGKPTIALDGNMHPYSAVNNQYAKFYRIAPVATNTISFVNGGENGNMRFSFSYMDNQSVVPKSWLKRYTANLNINQNITKKLKLSLVANYIDESTKLRSYLNDMSRNPNFVLRLLPSNIDPNYLKPGYDIVTGYEKAMNSDGYMPNPWFVVDKTINDTKRKRLITSSTVKYDIMKDLYMQARVGFDMIDDNLLNVEPSGIGFNRLGGMEQSKAQTFELNLDVLAGYSKRFFNDKFSLDASTGASVRKYRYDLNGNKGKQFIQPFLYTIDNLLKSASNPVPLYNYSQLQTQSGYYTLDLGYDNILTLGTTGRYDIFSTLPKGNWGIFTPSVSASFIFSELADIPYLNYGKLRASYAQTSGTAAPYKTSVYYNLKSGDVPLPYGTLDNTVVDQSLKPYRLKEYEIGLELKGLQNRIGLDITYFDRRTEKELVNKQISIATGYDYSYLPLGATENSGFEVMLTGTPIKSKNLTWNTSLNFTKVTNKLVSIDGTENPNPIMGGQYRPAVGPYNNGTQIADVQGLPLSQIMAYDYKRDEKGNIVVGSDGIPMRGNQIAMGSGLPKGYGGFNNDFTYKQFNLSFLIDFKYGNKVLSATDFFSMYYGLNKATLEGRETGIVVNGVTEDGSANQTLVSAQNYYQGLVKNVSTMSVFDGSFIKFRQVTLGYTFSQSLLSKTPFQSINISLVARNLFTILKYTKNFDPEDGFSPVRTYAGLEGIGIPQTRTYGINMNFKLKK